MSPFTSAAPLSKRCEIISSEEFEKLSKIVTWCPLVSRDLTRCPPINPAPPVMKNFKITQLQIFNQIYFSDQNYPSDQTYDRRAITNAKLRNNSQYHSLFFINSIDLIGEGSTFNKTA